MKTDEGCPVCKVTPLVIEWIAGTLDFYCAVCNSSLSPDAKTLIQLLPEQEEDKWWE